MIPRGLKHPIIGVVIPLMYNFPTIINYLDGIHFSFFYFFYCIRKSFFLKETNDQGHPLLTTSMQSTIWLLLC